MGTHILVRVPVLVIYWHILHYGNNLKIELKTIIVAGTLSLRKYRYLLLFIQITYKCIANAHISDFILTQHHSKHNIELKIIVK